MQIARPLQIIAMVAGLVAVSLGMGTYTHADFVNVHMVFGLIVAIVLLVLAARAVFTSELRRIGAISLIYALIVPVFGASQEMILVGDAHWLIEAAHLLVGFGALALIGTLGTRLMRRKQGVSSVAVSRESVPQAAR